VEGLESGVYGSWFRVYGCLVAPLEGVKVQGGSRPLWCQVSSAKCQVPSAKCQASSIKCQMSRVKYSVSSVKCQVSSVKCQVSSVGSGVWGLSSLAALD